MKKIIIPVVIVVVIIGLFAFIENRMNANNKGTLPPPPPAGGPPPEGSAATIRMKDTAYEPANITIEKGTTITFVNEGTNEHWPASNIHPTHQIYPEFDPQKGIPPGESWSFTFEKAGIWRWHDHLFPNVKGTITVEK